ECKLRKFLDLKYIITGTPTPGFKQPKLQTVDSDDSSSSSDEQLTDNEDKETKIELDNKPVENDGLENNHECRKSNQSEVNSDDDNEESKHEPYDNHEIEFESYYAMSKQDLDKLTPFEYQLKIRIDFLLGKLREMERKALENEDFDTVSIQTLKKQNN